MRIIETEDLTELFKVLQSRGYELIGPTIRDGAIVFDTLHSTGDLPKGWTDEQGAASYSLKRRNDDALFNYVVGPVSWKKFLFPPRVKLFTARKSGKGFSIDKGADGGAANGAATPVSKRAFIGIRPCELNAIAIQDKIFASGPCSDPVYKSLRKEIFVVAVNCLEPGGNCFCTSMGTGPRAQGGYDLVLTEILTDGRHCFAAEEGTEQGKTVLMEIPHGDASADDKRHVTKALDGAAGRMGRTMKTEGIKEMLYANAEHPEWDDVAKRCLTCTNCTMVCPTCFCSTVEDATDLSGAQAERWRRWDSCFTLDFARVAGGNMRSSTKARYRQWLTHKLAYWQDQFGTSGCVGCGRCITWCPVGIDITAEVEVLRGDASSPTKG
jgi:sulfhydrogenase subunit beta (sulfur reductase)